MMSATTALVVIVCCNACLGQTNPPGSCSALNPEPQPRRILGIFPNHNTYPCLLSYVPISLKEKFKIANEDALDPGAIVLASLTGGAAQLFNSNRPFGQEASGCSRYFAAAYANHVIGDYLTEGVYPSFLHQDPRYFRKGSGSKSSRVRYAVSRVFRTQNDAGGTGSTIPECSAPPAWWRFQACTMRITGTRKPPRWDSACSSATRWRPISFASSGQTSYENSPRSTRVDAHTAAHS